MSRQRSSSFLEFPVETDTPFSVEQCRRFILNALDKVTQEADFSHIRFLSESIPNVRSAAQDRGTRATYVVRGEKPITYARNGELLEDRCSQGTMLYAKKGAWQTVLNDKAFAVLGVVLERDYTRFLWVENAPESSVSGNRYYYHTQQPPPPVLFDIANALNSLLVEPNPDGQMMHLLMGSLWAACRMELQKKSLNSKARISVSVRRWKAIEQYITEHFNGPIYREDLGVRFGISATYISKLFQKYSNLSLSQFILKTRLDYAVNLLLYSHSSVSEIAYKSGFNDTSYFNRAFKKAFKAAPNEFRGRKN